MSGELQISIFPSAYRNSAEVTEDSRVQVQTNVATQGGREDFDQTRVSYSANGQPIRESTQVNTQVYEQSSDRQPQRFRDETNVRVYEDERRAGGDYQAEQDIRVYGGDNRNYREQVDVDLDVERKRYRQPFQRYADVQLRDSSYGQDRVYEQEYRSSDRQAPRYQTQIDITERDYRSRTQPNYRDQINVGAYAQQSNSGTGGFAQQQAGAAFGGYTQQLNNNAGAYTQQSQDKMGYYDNEGNYRSFHRGLQHAAERVTDRIIHPIHGRRGRDEEVDVDVNVINTPGEREEVRYVERRSGPPNTITIPCHHIRIGDLLILQGRPCQVIKITTSASTGQHRYLGVDLFTKQLYEESSFSTNPSASVYVQNMLGPIFKQYRVLDIRTDGRVVAMTESGDIKQGLPVLDQGELLDRLQDAFNNGRGSVRALVLTDNGRELAVDYKLVYGSRL